MGYIPNRDAAFALWCRDFAQQIAASPAVYMLSPADGAMLLAQAGEFQLALALARSPATSTRVTVNTKNSVRASIEPVFRRYAQQIKLNAGVSDGDKIALGLHLRPTRLSRRACPTTSPLLKFIAATPGRHELRYSDSLDPESPRKPFGARALQLFAAITPPTIAENGERPAKIYADQARYVGEYGRNPIVVAHSTNDAARTATYFGRWVGARNEHGPWSLPISAVILGGDAKKASLKLAA